MKIVADSTIPYLPGIAEPFAEVDYCPAHLFSAERVREADALIVRSINKCTRELLAGSRVKLITTATIGFDHIDTSYCDQAGITWHNAPGCNAEAVAQYLLTSLVALSLRRDEPLCGKVLGIVGMGHIGRRVERLCRAYGLEVLRNDPPRAEQEGEAGFVSLQQIAEEADIITLHVPLTRGGAHPTYHLVNSDFLNRLTRKPWLANACRGAVHDTEALLEARKRGQVSELILDCWENEPTIHPDLLRLAAIATPHIAGFSADGKANATRACLQAIGQHFGVTVERINQVTPPPPSEPVIDLDRFSTHRVEQALFHSFCPPAVDATLRAGSEPFEWLRSHYNHPREFAAYSLLNATPSEAALLKSLGFRA